MRRKLKITFKSGATIKVNASDWKFSRDAAGRKSLQWTTPRFAPRRLVAFEMDDVVAIVGTRW